MHLGSAPEGVLRVRPGRSGSRSKDLGVPSPIRSQKEVDVQLFAGAQVLSWHFSRRKELGLLSLIIIPFGLWTTRKRSASLFL